MTNCVIFGYAVWKVFLIKGRRESSRKEKGMRSGRNLRVRVPRSDGCVNPSLPLQCKAFSRKRPAGEFKESLHTGLSLSGPPRIWWIGASVTKTWTNLTPAKSPAVVNYLGWPMAEVLVIQLMFPEAAVPISASQIVAKAWLFVLVVFFKLWIIPLVW